jgi:hypothetical protein
MAERLRFKLHVREFPRLLGAPIPEVKEAAIRMAREEMLGEVAGASLMAPILRHPRSQAAGEFAYFNTYLFLGEELETETHEGVTHELTPHIHVDVASFPKPHKVMWAHSHIITGLRAVDRVAFAEKKKR